jgi:hypothetical protein
MHGSLVPFITARNADLSGREACEQTTGVGGIATVLKELDYVMQMKSVILLVQMHFRTLLSRLFSEN